MMPLSPNTPTPTVIDEARTGIDPEDSGIGERIPREGLDECSGDTERSADDDSDVSVRGMRIVQTMSDASESSGYQRPVQTWAGGRGLEPYQRLSTDSDSQRDEEDGQPQAPPEGEDSDPAPRRRDGSH